MSQSNWATRPISATENNKPLFFDAHQWATIEAATARIIPTDHHPGAREANVVRFIDRMLAGTQFVFPAADGNGFLEMEGFELKAWEERIADRRRFYVQGVERLDALADAAAGTAFVELDADGQDALLEQLSEQSRPRPYRLDAFKEDPGLGGAPAGNQPVNEDFLEFFPLLVLNTRQGFYADPVYGGNSGRIGWAVIGFDGPESLEATMDGTYSTRKYMIDSAEWPYDRHPEVLRYGNR